MELHVINRDAFVRSSHSGLPWLLLHKQLVIHAQFALWHATQFGVQFDDSCYICAEDGSLG